MLICADLYAASAAVAWRVIPKQGAQSRSDPTAIPDYE